MSANDSKRYYWLKLKEDFFKGHKIKVLKSLPNGRLYALIYVELMAESTSHQGELRYSKLLPYDIVTLSAVIDEDKDNVEKAIETFINLELAEIYDDGTIYMNEVAKLIGSETGQTIRKREAKIDQVKTYPEITPEIRYKSLENREKTINKKFVPQRIEEVEEYCKERNNNVDPKKFFEYYSIAGWKDSKGNPVKNWKQKMIANWEKDKPKQEEMAPIYDTKSNSNMSKEEEDELLKLLGGKQ